MKKVLALALALVMALSMSAMAFAANETYACPICKADLVDADELNAHMNKVHPEDQATKNICPTCGKEFAIESEYNEHIQLHDKTCPKCNRAFADEAQYNAHIEKCTYGDVKDTVDLTVKEILNMIIDLIKTSVDLTKASMSQWDAIESVVVRLVDFVENMGSAVVGEAEVKGAVADLESALAGIEIPGINDLLNQLKQKIKDMYAGEVATTVVEETTAAEEIVETGSSSVGIAVFAAVSVAAAAAYVCTKKSK